METRDFIYTVILLVYGGAIMYWGMRKSPKESESVETRVAQTLKPRAKGTEMKRKPIYNDDTKQWAKEREELKKAPPVL
jgi:hypothetical protein